MSLKVIHDYFYYISDVINVGRSVWVYFVYMYKRSVTINFLRSVYLVVDSYKNF